MVTQRGTLRSFLNPSAHRVLLFLAVVDSVANTFTATGSTAAVRQRLLSLLVRCSMHWLEKKKVRRKEERIRAMHASAHTSVRFCSAEGESEFGVVVRSQRRVALNLFNDMFTDACTFPARILNHEWLCDVISRVERIAMILFPPCKQIVPDRIYWRFIGFMALLVFCNEAAVSSEKCEHKP